MIYFYIGRVVALTFIVRLCLSAKSVVQPDYKTERIEKVTKIVIEIFRYVLDVKPDT